MSRPPNNGVKHAPGWAPASALLGLMLAGCAGGCAGSSPPKSSPSLASEALAGEVPPEPAYACGPWDYRAAGRRRPATGDGYGYWRSVHVHDQGAKRWSSSVSQSQLSLTTCATEPS